MNELDSRCANHFIPSSAADFIGTNQIERADGTIRCGAQSIALHLEKVVARARANGNVPIKLLFNGEPGIGKSNLVLYLQRLLGISKWSITKMNGTECKMEKIDELARSLQLRGLFDDYRMFWIDEASPISPAAMSARHSSMPKAPCKP